VGEADKHACKIFLSYAGADREAAVQVATGLRAADIDIWMDLDEIRLGESWIRRLEHGLSNCSGYMILVGTGGIRRWVTEELSIALRRRTEEGMPIFPLLLPGVTAGDLPPFLGNIQAGVLNTNIQQVDFTALANQIRAGLNANFSLESRTLKRPPFQGLDAFSEHDEHLFFGRQVETARLLGLLGRFDGRQRRWLHIYGASGAGKSSLIKAALVPSIRRGWVGTDDEAVRRDWIVAVMRAGSDPLLNLASALRDELGRRLNGRSLPDSLRNILADSQTDHSALASFLREYLPSDFYFCLVIDQLEEIFTLIPDEDTSRREQFDALVGGMLEDRSGRFYLITGMRADFMLQLYKMPCLEALITRRAETFYLGPMTDAGLLDAMRTPARRAGLIWEPLGLPERIVREMRESRAALPLLGNLLELLWRRGRSRAILSESDYNDLKGIGGALSESADGLISSLTETQRDGARRLLLALVRPGRSSADTRRTLTRRQAVRVIGTEGEDVLMRLSGGANPDAEDAPAMPRLVTVTPAQGPGNQRQAGLAKDSQESKSIGESQEDYVDLAHEALLTQWQKFKVWLDDPGCQEEMRASEDLEAAVQLWNNDGRPKWFGLPSKRQQRRFQRALLISKSGDALLTTARMRERRVIYAITTILALVAVLGSLWMHLDTKRREPIEPRRMVWIPPGEFLMGSPSDGSDSESSDAEYPKHKVVIAKGFCMSAHEVTFDEFDQYVNDSEDIDLPSDMGRGRGQHPVTNVTWKQALGYSVWLSKKTGKKYALPSEAQWEYAARAGTMTPRPWDNDSKSPCNYENLFDSESFPVIHKAWAPDWRPFTCEDKHVYAAPVGSYEKNPWGLHDMLGNVVEWVADCYHKNYSTSPPTDGSAWLEDGGGVCQMRVVKGGSWYHPMNQTRPAYRGDRRDVTGVFDPLGFRLIKEVESADDC